MNIFIDTMPKFRDCYISLIGALCRLTSPNPKFSAIPTFAKTKKIQEEVFPRFYKIHAFYLDVFYFNTFI